MNLASCGTKSKLNSQKKKIDSQMATKMVEKDQALRTLRLLVSQFKANAEQYKEKGIQRSKSKKRIS
jgi:hypothetical protein